MGELGVIEEDKMWAFFFPAEEEETRNEDLAGKGWGGELGHLSGVFCGKGVSGSCCVQRHVRTSST